MVGLSHPITLKISNFFLNGLEGALGSEVSLFRAMIWGGRLRYYRVRLPAVRTFFQVGGVVKSKEIACWVVRYVNSFVLLSESFTLLARLKFKVLSF